MNNVIKNRIKLSLMKNSSMQFLFLVIFVITFGPFFPKNVLSFFYSVSLTLKEILLFVLPAIVFCCLFSCFSILRGNKALKLLVALFSIVLISNYFSTIIAFMVGSLKLNVLSKNSLGSLESLNAITELSALWNLNLVPLLSNDIALVSGFVLGYFFSIFPSAFSDNLGVQAKRFVTFFLSKLFVPVLPFFALGFILKIQSHGGLFSILQSYISLMGIIALTYTFYLGILFFIAANFNVKKFTFYIKNVIPVAITAFSTISSIVTMPITISAAEKNTNDQEIARIVIPATVNIHTIGLAIGIPLMAFAILINFGYELPTFSTYCKFALYFVIAQFAIAAVPGSGVLVMIPLLETYLGFTAEMSALITVLYVLYDPLETIANTLGNSVLVIMLSNIKSRVRDFKWVFGNSSALAKEEINIIIK